MRASILNLLRNYTEEYISGEELSRQLAVSRTAIWKHIQALKQDGYNIEAHSRRGYRLIGIPDLLLPKEIQDKLTTDTFGRKEIFYHKTIDSTNNAAKNQANLGCPHGSIVLSEEQVGGRGRLSRGWFSPNGKGIWLSLVLRPPFMPYEAPKFTLMAAVAITKAIRKVSGIGCGIKWPNDILYGGKKLVGILTEMNAEIDAINYIVIGMGINVNINEFPEELQGIATSISMASGRSISRMELLNAVLSELEAVYKETVEHGFVPILNSWRELSITLGQEVNVLGISSQFSGVAVDIDDDGALLVKTAKGIERVLAGDVSIRPKI